MSKPILLAYATRYGSTKEVAEAVAATLRFPDSLLASLPASPLHNQPASDVRDWTAIHTWANNLIATLQAALSQKEQR